MKKILSLILMCSAVSFGSVYGDIVWSAPSVISTALTNASDPQVTIDTSGNATAVWVENGLIMASDRPAGGSWSSPTTISSVLETSSSPKLKIDSSGNATAMWIGNTQVETATRVLNAVWVPGILPVSSSGATSLSFDVDSSDNAVAVWVRGGVVESSTRKLGVWSAVSTRSVANSSNPSVAISNGGTAIAAWQSVVSGSDVITTSTLTISTNSWAATKNVFTATATFHHNYPKVAIDASGNATVCWYRYNLVGSNAYTNVILIAASLPTTSSTWGLPTILSSAGIRNPQDLVLRVKSDQNGDTIAAWTNSYDGESFNVEAARQLFGRNWLAFVTLQLPSFNSFMMDLAVASNAALMTNMAWDGFSSVTIQSQETDVSNPLGTRWTNVNLISTGVDNSYPKCALSLTGSTYNAAAVWVNYDGVNTIVNASIGSGPQVSPPTGVSATQSVTHYGNYDDYYNTVTWVQSPASNLIQYNVYRNGVLFANTNLTTLQIVDHNQLQATTTTYGVTAFTSDFIQSPMATFTLFP